MVKKYLKTFFIQIELPQDLKDILERRAFKKQHSLAIEIVNAIRGGLTETEVMQTQASFFIDKVLDARRRHRERKAKQLMRMTQKKAVAQK